jgi:osmotically-inducible protein OsmY
MDKHYGWQEGRNAQPPQGRFQNGQRWNERPRDDDRESRWASSGDFDREDYMNEGEPYGGSRGSRFDQWSPRSAADQGQWSQGGYNRHRDVGGGRLRNEGGRWQGDQGFSGGHYGGFANEGHASQSGYGQGGSSPRGFGSQNYGQTFGQGYAGSSSSNQRYTGHGYGPGYSGQGFAGRGPKGYQRSDERIKELVSDRLMDDDDIDATEITVDVKGGEVTLTGTVNSRQEKRFAEDVADATPGVREVQNRLRVQPPDVSRGGPAPERE